MNKKRPVDYIIMYFSFLIYSLVSVFAKMASGQDSVMKSVLFIALELGALGVYAIIWQQVLKKFPLSVAMSNKGVVVIISMIWSVLLFGETLSVYSIAGVVIIMAGIWMVSADG